MLTGTLPSTSRCCAPGDGFARWALRHSRPNLNSGSGRASGGRAGRAAAAAGAGSKLYVVALRGAFRLLVLYDVADAFDMAGLRRELGQEATDTVRARFPRRTPEYIRLEEPPLVGATEPLVLESGASTAATLRYYSYGVVVADLELPFECEWEELLARSARWQDGPGVEPAARLFVQRHLERLAAAVLRPNPHWLHEVYLLIYVQEIDADHGASDSIALLSRYGGPIAQLVRGETAPLSAHAIDEVLQTAMSYYRGDLVVLGSSAAFVYDKPDDAAAIHQILEYAKMQLLEFRYYDGLMSRLLAEVHEELDRPRNPVLSRWRLPRQAQRFNSIRLDVMNLTERVDNAIKFVSDAYYARVYRSAATRMGVSEYRDLVDEKQLAAAQLYQSMMDEFNEARSFSLEVLVAVLCLLDILFWLKFR